MSTNGVGSYNGSLLEDKYGSARIASVVYLCAVGVCGIIANSLVIFVFWKYPKLRTAANLFILNLAFCDLMLSIFDNTFSIASTLYGEWLFGRAGCISYGFFHYFFICCTVSTLAAISVDRFFFITRPNQTRAVQVITKRKAIGILLIIYLYTLMFTFPPCVGWNKFVEEPIFFSGCYVNYGDQRTSSIVYSIIAPVFLFMVPLTVMIYCYARIFLAVRRSTQRTIGRTLGTPTSVKKKYPLLKRTHIQTAKMIIVVIFFSMIVWVPYVVVSLIKAANGHIDPLVSHITVLVAKSCVIYNVLIYAILNRKLKAAILDQLKNGVVKSVEFKDGQRRDTVLGTSKEELEVVINGNGTVPHESNGAVYSELSLRRKKVSKIQRPSDVTRASNGSLVIADDRTPQEIASLQGASEKSANLNSEYVTLSRDGILPGGEFERTESHVTAETPLCSLPTESTGRQFQRVHHLYSSRSAKNPRSQTLSSPSQLYKKGARPISAQNVTKKISPDSSLPRASTSTDQDSDLSRGHSREGSFVQRSASSSQRPKKPRSGNRTNAHHAPSRRKSYASGRRGNIDPLHTSAQELLEIQNFWKRMSLCLDDIDLDEVTREMEMV
ncbi:hypothetical protein ACROYT_G030397 [Oculina patagonica]